jgi:hypothetical protein
MSAVASFYLINKVQINETVQNAEITVRKSLFWKKTVDNYYNFLEVNATRLPYFDGNGYVFGNVLPYLEETRGIDFFDSNFTGILQELSDKRGCFHQIITWHHKQEYLEQLKNNAYPLDELEKFNTEFSGEGGIAYAELAASAIKALTGSIEQIGSEDEVLLLIIG